MTDNSASSSATGRRKTDQGLDEQAVKKADILRAGKILFSPDHPLFGVLSFKLLQLENGQARIGLKIKDALRDGEVVQSGMLTLVLDTVFGMTLFTRLKELKPIATINLKTDYLRDAEVGERLICETECVHIHNQIAHMRGAIISEKDGGVLAAATGAFMIGSRGPAKGAAS